MSDSPLYNHVTFGLPTPLGELLVFLKLDGEWVSSAGMTPNVNSATVPYTEFDKISAALQSPGVVRFWSTNPADAAHVADEVDAGGPDHSISHVRVVDLEAVTLGKEMDDDGKTVGPFRVLEYRLFLADYRERWQPPRGGWLEIGEFNGDKDPFETLTTNMRMLEDLIGVIESKDELGTLEIEYLCNPDDVTPMRNVKWLGNHGPTELGKLAQWIGAVICPGSDGMTTIERPGTGILPQIDPDRAIPTVQLPNLSRKGKTVVFSSAPTPILDTRLTQLGDWTFVVFDRKTARWISEAEAVELYLKKWGYGNFLTLVRDLTIPDQIALQGSDDDIKAAILKQMEDAGDDPATIDALKAKWDAEKKSPGYDPLKLAMLSDFRNQALKFIRYPSPFLRMVRLPGQELPIVAEALVMRSSKTGNGEPIWANFRGSVTPIAIHNGDVLELGERLIKFGPGFHSSTDIPNVEGHGYSLAPDDGTVQITVQCAVGDLPEFFHLGFTASPGGIVRLSEDELKSAMSDKTGTLFINDASLELFRKDGEAVNEADLAARALGLAGQVLAKSGDPSKLMMAAGFVAGEVSGQVSEIHWDQSKLLTTFKVNNWFTPLSAIATRALIESGSPAGGSGAISSHNVGGPTSFPQQHQVSQDRANSGMGGAAQPVCYLNGVGGSSGGSGGGGVDRVSLFTILSIGDDTISCHRVSDADDAAPVTVAKDLESRRSYFDGKTIDGVTYTWTDSSTRSASMPNDTGGTDTETETLDLRYKVGDPVVAVMPTGGTGLPVVPGTPAVAWVDVRTRKWGVAC